MTTAFLFAALAVNQEQVALTFAVWQTPFTLSIFWWLLAALVIGILLGVLYSSLGCFGEFWGVIRGGSEFQSVLVSVFREFW